MSKTPKVALVYDKTNTRYGGAEVVLQALNQIFPEAPLFTSIYNPKKATWAHGFKIKTSFLQELPLLRNYHQLLAPLMPLSFETLNLDNYEIVISVTSGEAKGVITKPEQLHLSYILTPPRYLYSSSQEYLEKYKFFSWPVVRYFTTFFLKYLRWWDRIAASRPDYIITISQLVKSRVERYYQRKVETVIYPPTPAVLDATKIHTPKNYLLCVSRLVPYKKIDLCIESAVALQKTLIIAGSGIESSKLKKLHPSLTYSRLKNQTIDEAISEASNQMKTIVFLNSVSKKSLPKLFQNAELLLMPGLEDYGITALEAASYGVPSVIHKQSGSVEILGKYSFPVNNTSVPNIVCAIKKAKAVKIDPSKLKQIAQEHSTKNFTSHFEKVVYDLFIQHQTKGPDVY